MGFAFDLRGWAAKASRAWRRFPSPEALSVRFQTWNEARRAEAKSNLANIRFTPLNIVYVVVSVGGLANFLAFVVGSIVIGGDAFNGRIDAGHYLLSDHGHLHEVSERVYDYSLWHARSVFVTQPLAMLCGWRLSRDARKNTLQ